MQNNSIHSKALILILFIAFAFIALLVIASFIPSKTTINSKSEIINNSITEVWDVIYDKQYYFKTIEKNTAKIVQLDSIYPKWYEFYSHKDSIFNKCYDFKPNKYFKYSIINKKYEQVNGFVIKLDSIDSNHTKVTIDETSIYNNPWARTFYTLISKDYMLNYELTKIKNSLENREYTLELNYIQK